LNSKNHGFHALFLISTILAAAACAQSPQAAPAGGAPITLTLQDALKLARKNSIPLQAALTEQGVAKQDTVQARAALLPSVSFNNAYTFTEGTGSTQATSANQPAAVAAPRFIANNAVHEYLSQGEAQQVFGYGQIADYRRTKALEAVARAKADIAVRGLVVTVVQGYYGLIAAQNKYAGAQQAAAEAQRFLDLSKKLENGGEVAHSDVIKAQIQSNDRQRDLREAQLAMDKARLDLAVLLFPDFNQDFTVVDDTQLAPSLPPLEDFTRQAQSRNPDLRAASASEQAAGYELAANRAGYFPTLTLNYFYGIDASNFAIHSPEGFRNLGYAASATLNVPVWNWGATHSKVVQADLRRKQAQRELSLAQRKLQADMRELYADAQASRSELDLLKNSAELAAESLRLTNLRYQGGEATVLEVVDAQNTLTQARDAYNDGVVRYRAALANLQTLTGTM
jgi:outer membrane protein TolC